MFEQVEATNFSAADPDGDFGTLGPDWEAEVRAAGIDGRTGGVTRPDLYGSRMRTGPEERVYLTSPRLLSW